MCYNKRKAQEVIRMKIIVTGKNISVNDKIQEAIDKKFEKLGKYFADDIKANIVIHPEKAKVKMEATIVAKGTIFRAEDVSQDIFDCIDTVSYTHLLLGAADRTFRLLSKDPGPLLLLQKNLIFRPVRSGRPDASNVLRQDTFYLL